MTDVTVAATERRFSCADISKPTYKPPAKPDDERTQSRKLKVTGRLKVAIESMVWEGLKRDDAAKAVGLSVNALYAALRKPHVKSFYLSECEVLRTSGRARRIHRLEEISEASSNLNASVQAIRTLDAPDGGNSSMGSSRLAGVTMPGLVIQIVQATGNITDPQSEQMRDVTPKPLITQERDILHENMSEPGGGAGPSTGEAGRGEKPGRFARSPTPSTQVSP